MKIQVNTDHNIDGSEALTTAVEQQVQSALERFDERLTRIEVHLGDEDGAKSGSGQDKRCLIEARPAGMDPVVVTSHGRTLEQACADAAKKMQKLLTSTFGRRDDRDNGETIRTD